MGDERIQSRDSARSVFNCSSPGGGVADSTNTGQIAEIRAAVKALCARYGETYWLKLDAVQGYPTEFVRELTTAGFPLR